MSIVSFPSSNTRAFDTIHNYVTGSFVVTSDSDTWAPLRCADIVDVITGQPYESPNQAPFISFRESDLVWGWVCNIGGWYDIAINVLDLQAKTQPIPSTATLDYSLGTNGVVDANKSAVTMVRFSELNDVRSLFYRSCGRFAKGDFITPGSQTDVGMAVISATRIDGIFNRYRE